MCNARSKLKVGYVLKKYPRISETFVLDEVLALEAAGVEVAKLSLRLPDDGRFHSDLARVRGSVEYLPAPQTRATLHAFRVLEDPGGAMEALGPALGFLDRLPEERRLGVLVQALHLAERGVALRLDHLHAHFMSVAAQTAYLAHLFTGISFSVTTHAKDIYRQSVDHSVFREIASAARAVVTVCEANRRYILDTILDGARARVVCIYNGVFPDLIRPPERQGVPPAVIVAVGRLVEKKGFHVLLEACALLAGRGVEFRCVIGGEGEERAALEALRRRLGLEEMVRLVGTLTRDEVLQLMAGARVLAAPCITGGDGNRDALPTVLLEGLALGLPLVSTPIGGIPEIVGHEQEGLLVREGDPASLAAALERLLGQDDLWLRCSSASRAKALARFDRRHNLIGLVDLFLESTRPRRLSATA